MPASDKIVPASPDNIARAAKILLQGGLVVIPTETVYGVAADAGNDEAVKRLYAAKDRPTGKPVIVFTADTAAAGEIAGFTPLAEKLAADYWPGRLTLVLDRKPGPGLSKLLFHDETIGIRIPNQAQTLDLLEHITTPLAVTSANLSGAKSPAGVDDLEDAFIERVDLVLDGGPATGGTESTVADARGTSAVILREGEIPARALS